MEARGQAVPAAAPASDEFAPRATWSPPGAADVRKQVVAWLDAAKPAADIRQQVEALWPENESPAPNSEQLVDRVARGIALVEPAAVPLVELCSQSRQKLVPPEFSFLSDDKLPPFVRNNLRLLYGRWLGQERYYDESLAQLEGLQPQDVVDPASLLFYQGVDYHWLLKKEAGVKALTRLFERRDEIPRRYLTVGILMQADLAGLKDESLDHVSRRMDDVTRRLEFGRAGKKVQGVENGIIASLDKLIEKMEQEQQQGDGSGGGGGGSQPGGQGPAQGIRSTAPAADSTPATGKGPGNNNKKNIGSKSGWGDLPAKEREEALQQIGKDFPSHYREIVEQYFRRIAESE